MNQPLRIAIVWGAVCAAIAVQASAGDGYRAYQRSQMYTWHGSYYHPAYGAPVALLVPPTAGRQTNYHWGVAGYRTSPIYHQFRRGYPGTFTSSSPTYALPTPLWPSDTNQFGVYPVRAPW